VSWGAGGGVHSLLLEKNEEREIYFQEAWKYIQYILEIYPGNIFPGGLEIYPGNIFFPGGLEKMCTYLRGPSYNYTRAGARSSYLNHSPK